MPEMIATVYDRPIKTCKAANWDTALGLRMQGQVTTAPFLGGKFWEFLRLSLLIIAEAT